MQPPQPANPRASLSPQRWPSGGKHATDGADSRGRDPVQHTAADGVQYLSP
eukprot:gene10335-60370_t